MSGLRHVLAGALALAATVLLALAVDAHHDADAARTQAARAAQDRAELERDGLAAGVVEARIGELEARYALLDRSAETALARLRVAIRATASEAVAP